MGKIHSTSFLTGLTAGQREELFVALSDGLSYAQAREKIHDWYQENAGTRRLGFRLVNEVRRPSITAIGEWYRAAVADQRYAVPKEVVTATEDSCPADYAEQASRAIGQARYFATKEGLHVAEIATLERNELARERLALERERLALDARHQRCTALLNQAQALSKRAEAGEKGLTLQGQIDLVLEEIEHMIYGDDYRTLSPWMKKKYGDQNLPPPSQS